MRVPGRHHGRHAGLRPGLRECLAERRGAPVFRSPRSPRSLRRQIGRAGLRTVTRTAIAAALLIGMANLAPSGRLPTGPFAAESPSPAQARLMHRFDCSPDGFGDGSTPRSAIIRSEDGRLRVVSFDVGWRIYTGKRSQALVALCHQPPG